MEKLEEINKRLAEHFGVAWNGWAIWRIVWSETQFEKRFGSYDDYTSNGVYLRTRTEWREVPKYRQWIQEKWVLERLTVVPEVNKDELTEKVSYEPTWVFEDKEGKQLPYKWEVAKFVIDAINSVAGKSSMHKYVDPELDPDFKEQQLQQLQDSLFGNETDVGDALAHHEAVIVPRNYKQEN